LTVAGRAAAAGDGAAVACGRAAACRDISDDWRRGVLALRSRLGHDQKPRQGRSGAHPLGRRVHGAGRQRDQRRRVQRVRLASALSARKLGAPPPDQAGVGALLSSAKQLLESGESRKRLVYA